MAGFQIQPSLAVAAGAAFGPLCFVSVGLRLCARRYTGAHIGLDDWAAVAALVGNQTQYQVMRS